MPVTLASLLAKTTREEVATLVLLGLQGVGFPTDAWSTGSVPKRLINAFSTVTADGFNLMSSLAGGGFVDLAKDLPKAWLTLLAKNIYDVDRKDAVFAAGDIVLTDAGGVGPVVVGVGTLRAASTSGKVFVNSTGGTLLLSGTLSLSWIAETAGGAYNVATGDITKLLTPIPGVTINNPGSGGVWLTTYGSDEEDQESLATRCKARWPGLGGGATDLVWQAWCLEASPEVGRVTVKENDPEDGKVRLLLYTSAGTAVSGTAVTDVTNYVESRRPQCTKPVPESVVPVTVNLAGELYVATAYAPAALASVADKLVALTALRASGQTVHRADIVALLMSVTGADNAVLTTPTLDVPLAANEVAAFVSAITVVAT